MQESLVVTEGTDDNLALGYTIFTAIIDNLSSSWAFVTPANRPVPPWTFGTVLPLTAGAPSVQVKWRTPTGIVVPTSGTGQLTLTADTDRLPYNPGITVQQAQPTGGASPATVFTQPQLGYLTTIAQGVNASSTVTLAAQPGMVIHIGSVTYGASAGTSGPQSVKINNDSGSTVWEGVPQDGGSTNQASGHFPFSEGGVLPNGGAPGGVGLSAAVVISASGVSMVATILSVVYAYRTY